MIVTLVSMSPYESCLVDSVDHVLLVSLMSLAPAIFSVEVLRIVDQDNRNASKWNEHHIAKQEAKDAWCEDQFH